MALANKVRIDVFSDTICPWCWIGKRRLTRTLDARPDLDAVVFWHPFQLNPEMPPAGMDRRAYLEAKFGGPERARAVYERVRAEGAKESLPFDFDAIPRTPNTVDSHRLVRWAASRHAGQDVMVEALFEAYFSHAADVSDIEVLADVAGDAGFDRDAARDYLHSDDGRDEVRAEDAQARASGISAVPCFIVDGKFAVPGAIEPEPFLELFDRHRIGQPSDARS